MNSFNSVNVIRRPLYHKIAFAVLTLSLFVSTAFARPRQKFALVFGGSGNSTGSVIDPQRTPFGIITKSLSHSGFRLKTFYGDHEDTNTMKLLRLASFQPRFPIVKPEPVRAEISRLVSEIRAGKILRDDQILIYFDGHGGLDNGEHYVDSGGSFFISKELELLRNLAQQYGILLGVVDFSCHAGRTVEIANANTCAIAASTHLGYTTVGNSTYFAEEVKSNVSLEDAYLKFRKKVYWSGLPQISTAAGKVAGALTSTFEDQSIGAYGYWLSDFESRLDSGKPASFMSYEKIDHIRSAGSNPKFLSAIGDYRLSFEKYEALLKSLEFRRKMLAHANRTIVVPAIKVGEYEMFALTFKWSDLIRDDFSQEIVHSKKVIYENCKTQKCTENEKADYDLRLMQLNHLLVAKYKLEFDVLFTDFRNRYREYFEMAKVAAARVPESLQYERYFYNHLYQDERARAPDPNDPCRRFKF